MRQDLISGLVLSAIGAGAVLEGRRHHIGTLREMQAGYFPVALGTLMVMIGLLMAGLAVLGRDSGEAHVAHKPDWHGTSAIVAGVVCFIALGAWFGLAPATFSCVLISALGDRAATWRGALGLAVVLTVAAVLVFAYLLQVPFPIWQWPA